jgi:hypothetical protein
MDAILSLALGAIELQKAKINEKINHINIKMRQANTSANSEPLTPAIGFKVSDDEYYEEEDDFYEN